MYSREVTVILIFMRTKISNRDMFEYQNIWIIKLPIIMEVFSLRNEANSNSCSDDKIFLHKRYKILYRKYLYIRATTILV